MAFESVLYFALLALALFSLVVWWGCHKMATDGKRILLTQEQLRCHGVWQGEAMFGDFYFCVHEIGQFVEGVFFKDGTETQFSGTYLPPVLTFECLDTGGSTLTFKGTVAPGGAFIEGQCIRAESVRNWEAQLLSKPSQTKALDLDVLRQLTATYMGGGDLLARTKLLASTNLLGIEESAHREDESVKVWKPESVSTPSPVPLSSPLPLRVPSPAISPSPTAVDAVAPSAVAVQPVVPVPSPVSGTFPAPSSEGGKKCPKCSALIDEAFHFCLHCGHAHSS